MSNVIDKATIENRVKELSDAVDKSVANHNSLVGRLQEAKGILDFLMSGEQAVEAVVEAVEAADAVIDEVQ